MGFRTFKGEWRITTLGELIETKKANIQTGPFGTMLKASSYQSRGTPVIAVKDIGINKIIHGQSPFIGELDVERLRKYKLKKGDIIFGRKGAVERRALVTEKEEGWIQGSDCIRLRFVTDDIDPAFVSYFLGTRYYINWIQSNAQGTTMPSLNQEILKRCPLPLPPVNEQKTVSNLLKKIDDKFELNNAINKNLEEMAQALFKRWFVDFEFPNENGEPYKSSGGELEDSELGLIPKGWKVATLGEIINISSGKRPNFREDQPNKECCVPLVGASGIMGYVQEVLYDEAIIVIGRVGTLGVVQRYRKKCWPSDNTLVIKSDHFELVYQYLKKVDFKSLNRGSTQPLISQTEIKKLKIVIPCKKITNKFENTIASFYFLTEKNLIENEKLIQIRDTLLPKLMSGEIRVPLDEEYSHKTQLPTVAENTSEYKPVT